MKARRGSIGLYLGLLALVIVAMIGLRECSAEGLPPHHEGLAAGDTLNVAIEISPMSLSLKEDTLSGHYYDLMRRICAAHQRPVRFVPFTRVDDALEGLRTGKYQVVIADIPVTAELKEQYLFLDPVGLDRQVLVQRRDSAGELPVADQFALAKRAVTVPKGSPFIPRLENLAAEIGDTIYIVEDPEYSSEQLIILVAVGERELTVASEGVARDFLKDYPQLDAQVAVSLSQFQSWAVNRADSALRDTLNRWLKSNS